MPETRKDPLPAFCFKVQIDDIPNEIFFKSVGGLKFETEVVDYRAGGVNNSTYKLVGATKWPNIVLKRGFTTEQAQLVEWRNQWLSREVRRRERKNGTIIQLDTQLNEKGKWEFVEAWPVKWELSELDAAKNEIAIETLELAHHGLTFRRG